MRGALALVAAASFTAAAAAAAHDHRDDIHAWIVQCDTDHDGRISRAEFIANLRRSPTSHLITDREADSMFRDYDMNGDGFITEDEIKAIARRPLRWPALR